jgi:hypothetical protein
VPANLNVPKDEADRRVGCARAAVGTSTICQSRRPALATPANTVPHRSRRIFWAPSGQLGTVNRGDVEGTTPLDLFLGRVNALKYQRPSQNSTRLTSSNSPQRALPISRSIPPYDYDKQVCPRSRRVRCLRGRQPSRAELSLPRGLHSSLCVVPYFCPAHILTCI